MSAQSEGNYAEALQNYYEAMRLEIDPYDRSYILYNIGRDIYFGKTNSKVMSKYTAAMDIKNLIIVSDTTFVVIYSNSLEVVTV